MLTVETVELIARLLILLGLQNKKSNPKRVAFKIIFK
jgi:hypothetical protein